MNDQDLLEFVDDDVPSGAVLQELSPWRILVVDDDVDVHESTAFGLRGMEVEGRALELLHAYSGGEAMEMLRRHRDVAVILLDVVMETDDAGLKVVERIRGELGMAHVRIVLRTGQPGQAPEIETIRRYDINDYKSKSELTRVKLYTALTAAIRAYDQLLRLDASRRGLEKIIEASNHFLAEQGLRTFAEGVITQIASLIGVQAEGLVCAAGKSAARSSQADDAPAQAADYTVIAAAGHFTGFIDQRIQDIGDPLVAASLEQALTKRHNLLEAGHVTLFFPGREGRDFAAFVRASEPLREVDVRLLEVFCTNIALSASNIDLLTRLRQQAFVDRLLGLPNRTALVQLLDEALADGRGAGQVLALLDINRFAETNDMFGYAYGDRLLAAIAQRLRTGLPPSCVLARVAGDTFGVWGDPAVVEPARLLALLEQPFEIEGAARPVSLSIGLVRHAPGMHDGQDLFKNASIALKQAKSSGHGRAQYYTAEVGLVARERTRLLHGLQAAFNHQSLFLVYQPQVDLSTGVTVAAEALLRWRTAEGKFIPPDQFIPVAEQSGLIVPIGNWVLRTALRALASIRAQGIRLRMAVNVSPLQFAQPEFLAGVDDALLNAGVAPEDLELEITESVAVMGMDRVAALLGQIKSRGISVAIDDFGTGFSSLSYLDRLPADCLKIDRAFVTALDSTCTGARIAEMIVPLGQRLGMRVLAEGVETETQALLLRALGCDEVQGYLFAKPMPLDELTRWLKTNGST
jgi:diguanylate cyclase (GGDEF)-like protein